MVFYWTIATLFIVAITLNLPMARKPLSEDDGNWYYPAMFRNRGCRLYKNYYWAFGYFCIHWLASIIYNLFNFKNLKAFYYFKIIWYSLTSISIYWLTYCFWHNEILSLISGLIFVIATAVPNTLFMLTYGEHFFILPINICIIFTYYGISTGNLLFYFLAGLSSAWAFQIKPTALLFCILLPVSFYFSPELYRALLIYFTAFFILNFLPLLTIQRVKGNEHKHYFRGLIGPIIGFMKVIFDCLRIKPFSLFIVKLFKWLEYPETANAYVEKHHKHNIKAQWASFKRFMLPAIMDLYLILVLAVTQIVLLFLDFDPFCFSMALLLVIFLLMQQAQKNYYTPHFNPCWAPVTILAAKTVYDFWPYLLNCGIYGLAVIAFLSYESIKITRIIIKSFLNSEINSFGHLDPLFGKVFRLCEPVGEFIQQNSNEKEKLFIWGDQPSLYLYARREIFNINYLLIYAQQENIILETELLDSIRKNPPDLLLFYNYKILDGWNIERLQKTIGIPYKFMRSFQVTDDKRRNEKNPQGICFDFPLYRRDDEKYKEILLDRALIAEMNKDANETRRQLENILEISPEDYEASIRLSLLEKEIVGTKAEQSYLEEKLAENHDSTENAILLRLLAESNVDTGDLDNAIRNYEKALDSNPNDFRIHNGLGELYFSMDRIDDAFESFKKAIELHPYSSDVLNNIGVLLSQSGKRDDAIKYFQKALSFMPSHPDARNNMEALT